MFVVEFITQISIRVPVDYDDEDSAVDIAHDRAEGYLQTITGDQYVSAYADLDGIGAHKVTEK